MRGAFWLIYLRYGAPILMRGGRRVPRRGGLLVISNHQSSADPPVVQIACRRTVHFLARRELLEMKNISGFIQWWRIIPISQSKPDKGALKTAIATLKAGRCVGIFPEGQLSDTGVLHPIMPGVAMIIRMAQVPCICIGVQNTRFVMPNETEIPRWSGKAITARWGEPRSFGPDAKTEEILTWIEAELNRLRGPNEDIRGTGSESAPA